MHMNKSDLDLDWLILLTTKVRSISFRDSVAPSIYVMLKNWKTIIKIKNSDSSGQ